MPTEKTVNYTEAMVTTLLENVPFDHAKAKAFASVLDRNPQSIVAKLKRLEADESIEGERPFYNAKEAYVPKTGKPVEKKSEIVVTLEVLLGADTDYFKGLDKAPKGSLEKVRERITFIFNDEETLVTLLDELEERTIAKEIPAEEILAAHEEAQVIAVKAGAEADEYLDGIMEKANDVAEGSDSSDEG